MCMSFVGESIRPVSIAEMCTKSTSRLHNTETQAVYSSEFHNQEQDIIHEP